ncbi:hypothetical protein HYW21_05145 [Candidatus Woesearchaeota archaeon]|nr:hypothetical protein [Candidatus Woesearchaeota archaeon]
MSDISNTVDTYFCLGLDNGNLPDKGANEARIEAYNLGSNVRREWGGYQGLKSNLGNAQWVNYLESMRQGAADPPTDLQSAGLLPVVDSDERRAAESDLVLGQRRIIGYLNNLLSHQLERERFPQGYQRVEAMLREARQEGNR